MVLKGDEAAPVAVRMVPWGSVAGRLVDKDGRPLAGWTVMGAGGFERFTLDWGRYLDKDVITDADGRFRLDGLVPGLLYSGMPIRDSRGGEPIFDNLKVEAGEGRDLGTVAAKPFE